MTADAENINGQKATKMHAVIIQQKGHTMQATMPKFSSDDILTVQNAVNPEHAELINMAREARVTLRSVEYAVNSLQSAETVIAAARLARKQLHELERLYVAAAVKGYINTERGWTA